MSGAEPVVPLTVRELTRQLQEVVEEGFPDVFVTGEISNLTRARSGHVYLTLKDAEATLSAVIWRSTAERIRHELDEGMAVLARGGLKVYPPRGQYQLVIRGIRPHGVGALQQAFEKLRARLEAEGLFDPAKKRPIPLLPQGVGVVTSRDGAAIRDVLKVVRRRFPGMEVVLAPARVQGDGSAEEVAAGIRRLNERGGLDVLIVGRGGGSAEDLWAFNEEPVARAIAASGIPVISAVGHEVDVTIADYVADVRAATPSAAAEIAVPDRAELVAGLRVIRRRLDTSVRSILSRERERLRALGGAYGVRRFLDRLREHSQRLDELSARLADGGARAVRERMDRLAELAGRAAALSPLAVLGRGYSVTFLGDGETPLRDASEVEPGSGIRTRLAKGEVRSCVEEVRTDE